MNLHTATAPDKELEDIMLLVRYCNAASIPVAIDRTTRTLTLHNGGPRFPWASSINTNRTAVEMQRRREAR